LALVTIYLFSLRKLVSQLRCGYLVVSELPVTITFKLFDARFHESSAANSTIFASVGRR